MINKIELTVAILAGGKSNRFGSPKELSKIQNKTLLQHSLSTAKSISEQVILISGTKSFDFKNQVPLYHDLFPGYGPLSGITTSLYYAKTDYVAIMPCDMPLLESEVYELLVEITQHGRPTAALFSGALQPLVSIWQKVQFSKLERFIQERILCLKTILMLLGVNKVDLTAYVEKRKKNIFLNINHKRDLEWMNAHLQ
jgi:molybdopterin-guanine dinucleotide biosynthesis protein A